ncbi:MAG TPA: XdhC/CoxI family protein [Clostridia bacterium]|nr:XdhC/CoxI family protein [Clostridia bacterium]
MNDCELMHLTLAAREAGRDYALVTIVKTSGSVPRKSGKLLVYASGETAGTVGGGAIERAAIVHALECIRRGKGDYIDYDLGDHGLSMACGGAMSLFTEVYRARPKLIVCGAGHVGLALAAVARPAGFDVAFYDDRDPASLPGTLSPEDAYTQIESFEQALRRADIPSGAYYVIVTHGHRCDAEALAAILPKKAAYIGMIGSKSKIRSVYQTLIEQGFEREALKQVYSPIGLDIGGETPKEIAVAIVAEMLAVRYGRDSGHLRRPDLVP